MKAIVIGAGLGGISAALRLRAKGYEVTIIDKLNQLGGRARVFKQDGFTFDAGPTVITAPFLIDEIFQLFNKKTQDYVNIVPVDPWYRFMYEDGEIFDYGDTFEKTIKEIERISPQDVKGYHSLLKESKAIFDIGFTELSDVPFHNLKTFIKQVPQMVRLKAFRSVYNLVKSHLKHEKLVKAFSIQPLLVGGNPFDTTCIYNLIHYLEKEWGIHYAMGGTGSLVKGFEKLMIEEGIKIKLNSEVVHLHGEEKIESIQLANGEMLHADIFVNNGDPSYMYKNCTSKKSYKKWNPNKIDKLNYSMGLFVIYFGTDIKYEDIKHHTIIMGQSYKGILDDIFKKKELQMNDASLYLHRPSATDPSMAPEGHDCFYVLSPVPNLQANIHWETTAQTYKNLIYDKLEKACMPNLRKHIVSERILDPQGFKTDYNSNFGTAFSIAPNLTQSAYFRFHNKSEEFENFYLVGAGTHPGAGIPGVLCSSKVLEKVIP